LSLALDELLEEAFADTRTRGHTQRLRAHVLAQLVCLGRHTVTGLLSTCGRQFGDWSADYRLYSQSRVDPAALFGVVRRGVQAQLPANAPLVVAMDDSLLRKRGRKIAGTAWRRDPLSPRFALNWVWGQRVLQLSAALPLDQTGRARLLPIDFVQAPTATRPRKNASSEAWPAYRRQQKELNLNVQALRRVAVLRRQIEAEAPERRLWLTIDGRFTNRTLLRGLPADVTAIGRIRADAKLHRRPTATARSPQGGRPRYYGLRLPTPEQIRQDESVPWQTVRAYAAGRTHDFRLKTAGPLRWRAAGGTRDLRLIVIAPLAYRLTQAGKLLYRRPAYLICTDPSLPLEQVLQAYLWRWEIEVNLRDEKTVLGVGQAQVRQLHAVQNVPATAVAAYALLLLAAARAYGPAGQPDQLPLPAWRRRQPPTRATTVRLINQLRCELWGHAIRGGGLEHFSTRQRHTHNSPKPMPVLESALFYTSSA
jgi:hypothetical protein